MYLVQVIVWKASAGNARSDMTASVMSVIRAIA